MTVNLRNLDTQELKNIINTALLYKAKGAATLLEVLANSDLGRVRHTSFFTVSHCLSGFVT